jgi:ActR/RegA family two-component response regulator
MEPTETPTLPAPSSRGNILFADDDQHFRGSMVKCLTRIGFVCEVAGSAKEAVELLRTKVFDVLLSDINMPGNSDLELVENLPPSAEGLPVILLTGDPSVVTATRSVRLRVMAYLTKPPDIEDLCRLLDSAVAERRNFRVLKDSRQRLQDWDKEIARLQQLLTQPADSERRATMQSYLRLTLRHLVVSLIELENLLTHDGDRLGTDQALEKQELVNALRKTVGVLEKTKGHFKSKELGELRKDLETLLG